MITWNGTSYNCDVSFSRGITFEEEFKVETKDGKYHRKIKRAKKSATIGFSSIARRDEYNRLFTALSQPSPYGLLGIKWGGANIVLEVMITGVSDTLLASDSEGQMYSDLQVTFEER